MGAFFAKSRLLCLHATRTPTEPWPSSREPSRREPRGCRMLSRLRGPPRCMGSVNSTSSPRRTCCAPCSREHRAISCGRHGEGLNGSSTSTHSCEVITIQTIYFIHYGPLQARLAISEESSRCKEVDSDGYGGPRGSV